MKKIISFKNKNIKKSTIYFVFKSQFRLDILVLFIELVACVVHLRITILRISEYEEYLISAQYLIFSLRYNINQYTSSQTSIN